MPESNNPLQPACSRMYYEVTQADLPLCCPMPNMQLWNAHPRVYLPIEEEKEVTCPYCGSEYFLKDNQHS